MRFLYFFLSKCNIAKCLPGGYVSAPEHTHKKWTWNPILQTVLNVRGLVDKDIRINHSRTSLLVISNF